jgi:hypothetical protein
VTPQFQAPAGLLPSDRSLVQGGAARADDHGRASDAFARSQVRRRRRDTLGVLAVTFVGTLLIGLVPGASAAWIVSIIAGVSMAAYVALLVHLRRNAEDTAEKLRYLQPGSVTAGYPVGGQRVPVYMSGRYAHPSNQAAAVH